MKLRARVEVEDERRLWRSYGVFVDKDGNLEYNTNLMCKYLETDDTGMFYCKVYRNRPKRCDDFPWEPGQAPPTCGYRWVEK